MRDRANEIHKLHAQLTEKDEAIQVLDNQLELLRRQLMAQTRNGIANGSPKASHEARENRETQTSRLSSDTISNSSSTRRRRKRGGCCCVIS